MKLLVAIVVAQLVCQIVRANAVPSGNKRSVQEKIEDDSTNNERTSDLETSDTQIASIILQNGPGGTHHVILPQAYNKAADQPNSRYADDRGYSSQTFVLSGNNFSPINDEFHHTIPPPLHATTYGPPQPVSFNSFRNKPLYNHRFSPARSNGQPKFGFQAKEIFKPANHGLSEPVKYNQHLPHESHGKTGPQLFHSEESYSSNAYTADKEYTPAQTYGLPEAKEYTPATTYGLPEEEPQREHEIPSVRVNVDHSSKHHESFPGKKFYQDSFFDIKPKHLANDYKHDGDDESDENDDENNDSKSYEDVGYYAKYAPRLQNYIPPSYTVIKPYLTPTKGVSKSYAAPRFVHGVYVQKYDQSHLEPNPPRPDLQPYYKRPLPIIQTQLPAKTHYYGYSENTGYPYEPEYYGHYPQEKSASIKDRFVTSNSEWTPINAPDGAVPAKSYDIPAPDLSNGYHDKVFRRGTEDHSIVIGKNKQLGKIKQKIHGNSEGVVSAVVRVKQ